jgi:GNAT superfamily N-acetyltransferase
VIEMKIRRPVYEDTAVLNDFLRVVITDTFFKEGIGGLLDDISKEIEVKKEYLQQDLSSGGEDRYFLLAEAEGKIIGTVEFGPVSKLILEGTNRKYSDLFEVGTVFIHPDFQGQGVGSRLLSSLYPIFQEKGIEEFCLDSGYKRAQKIWERKFGQPSVLMEDYWGEGSHHMIWRLRTAELQRAASDRKFISD